MKAAPRAAFVFVAACIAGEARVFLRQGRDMASGDELVLAIDCGTQSVRALVVDLRGEILAKQQQTLTLYVSPRDGWLEHDAEAFWRASAAVCRALWRSRPDLRDRVRGLAVSTQRGSLTLVDAQGDPLRPCGIGRAPRRASRAPGFRPGGGGGVQAARVSDTIDHFCREAELNWIAEHEPQLLARTHKALLLSGWLHYRLTGRLADSVGAQVGYLPFDFRRQRWAGGFDWKWQALPVTRAHMPDLVPVGEPLGGLTAEAAEATGLPQDLPVIAAGADKACELIGAGAVTPDIAALSYGTTATVDVTSPRYVEPMPFVPPYPSLLRGQYATEVQIFRGYWMVNWFKQQFGHPEIAQASDAGVPPEVLFDSLVNEAPPGAAGLMLQPYWSPGLRHPGPEARGAIIGFTAAHTRAHLYRAILEGLAYALREGKERIAARGGFTISSLRVSGGGSQSDAAMQMTADIFNLPAIRPHTYETSGLGAAIVAAVGLRLHPDMTTAVAAMTRPGRAFDPDPARAALYDDLYRRVYLRMYPRLAPLYGELRRTLAGRG